MFAFAVGLAEKRKQVIDTMAKSNKSTPRNQPPQRPATPAKPSSGRPAQDRGARAPVRQPLGPPRDYLARPEIENSLAPSRRRTFWILAAVGLVALIALSFGSGINADDKFQVDYSQKLVNYYGTFGKDTSALHVPDGNMHLYGGAFETVTGFANKAFGFQPTELAYHQVRHVSSAILGWVAILCAALLAGQIAGWQAATFTLVLLLLSPRFVGDSLMNPKDIPFAAGYMLALYNMVAVLDRMPNPRRWNLVGLAGGLALGLAIRAGGLLTFAMLFLFSALHFLLKNGGMRAFSDTKLLRKYALVTIGTAVAGYIGALLFWPYALQSPLKNPFVALSQFAALEVKIRVLFEGVNMMSDKVPWFYAIKWILYTIPLAALIGFFGSFLLLGRLLRRYQPLWIGLVWFAAIFPVFYVIYKHSVIHDGWRHLTFSYPPLAIAAGLFWKEISDIVSGFWKSKFAPWATAVVFVALSGSGLAYIISNPAFPYTYFNQLTGGTKGAYGKFETDYWGVSVRQGLEWMEGQGILKEGMTDTVTIATNMYYSAKQLCAKYNGKVRVRYLKWEKRCDEPWDYALYPTRFLDGATLQKGMWPPDNAVHLVTADGIPLLAVLKDNGHNCASGIVAIKSNDWQAAIEKFKAELANVPDNDLAWSNLAQAYLNANQLDEALAAANKALEISPDDTQSLNIIGMAYMQKGDINRAKSQFELSIKREPSNPGAYYYLALIARSKGSNQEALNYLERAFKMAPNFRPAYEMSAQIYEEMGDQGRASQFRQFLQQMK